MSHLFLLLVLAMAAFVAADVDYIDEYSKEINKELQLLQPSSLRCPDSYIGHACPEADLFFHYKCCGPRNKDCCQTPQPWVEFIAALFVALIGLTAICCCICCCCACSR